VKEWMPFSHCVSTVFYIKSARTDRRVLCSLFHAVALQQFDVFHKCIDDVVWQLCNGY
jgi:hypothetical protein